LLQTSPFGKERGKKVKIIFLWTQKSPVEKTQPGDASYITLLYKVYAIFIAEGIP